MKMRCELQTPACPELIPSLAGMNRDYTSAAGALRLRRISAGDVSTTSSVQPAAACVLPATTAGSAGGASADELLRGNASAGPRPRPAGALPRIGTVLCFVGVGVGCIKKVYYPDRLDFSLFRYRTRSVLF